MIFYSYLKKLLFYCKNAYFIAIILFLLVLHVIEMNHRYIIGASVKIFHIWALPFINSWVASKFLWSIIRVIPPANKFTIPQGSNNAGNDVKSNCHRAIENFRARFEHYINIHGCYLTYTILNKNGLRFNFQA